MADYLVRFERGNGRTHRVSVSDAPTLEEVDYDEGVIEIMARKIAEEKGLKTSGWFCADVKEVRA